MAIAAGCDYGVLSRITELTRPSVLERALLCPHRAYYVTVKVKNPMGLPGAKSLQGDIICFTQDGPAEALHMQLCSDMQRYLVLEPFLSIFDF